MTADLNEKPPLPEADEQSGFRTFSTTPPLSLRTLLLAIPYAVAVRDVLRSGTFKTLVADGNTVIVVMAADGDLRAIEEEFAAPNVRFEPLNKFKTTLVERFLYNFSRGFLYHKSRTIQLGNTGGMTPTLRAAVVVGQLMRVILGERRVFRMMAWCFRRLTPTNQYREVFAKYRPDLVVVTRVLNFSLDYPVMKRAAVENVPTVVLVSSWDNLTSKGFFVFDAERLVVWNDVMKHEAVDLYFYPPERVSISGIPRYDVFFRREDLRCKHEFLTALGLDSTKRLVTYATGSAATGRSPYDSTSPEPEIAEFLAEAITSGKIPNAQLLVRLHPQADPAEYASLTKRSDVLVQVPGRSSSFVDRLFSPADERLFAELMTHSDVVVNMFSTITLDAVACGTPVVGVHFDFRGPRPFAYSMRRFAEFDHNAKLLATGCARLADSPEMMIELICRYLDEPSRDAEERRIAAERYCVYTDGRAGIRAGRIILDVLAAVRARSERRAS